MILNEHTSDLIHTQSQVLTKQGQQRGRVHETMKDGMQLVEKMWAEKWEEGRVLHRRGKKRKREVT